MGTTLTTADKQNPPREKDASSEHHYFAFISYSKDRVAAAWLQRTLEHFRYPREDIRADLHPSDPKYVREIFLDKSVLSGRPEGFKASLSEALRHSRYLIVLCSPRSARRKQSSEEIHWVEWEIETFRQHHGANADRAIIPVIFEGEPDLSENSCLPLPIRTEAFIKRPDLPNFPDMRSESAIETRRRKRDAWEAAVITLLSYVFDVERNILRDRFALERAKARARIAVTAGIALAIAVGLTMWGLSAMGRAAQAVAFRNLAEAEGSLRETGECSAASAFNGMPDALSLLDGETMVLREAREWFCEKLLGCSWIVPIEWQACTSKYEALFAPRLPPASSSSRIVVPPDYPIRFQVGSPKDGQRLEAFDMVTGERLWQSKEPVFFVGGGEVDPSGRILLAIESSPVSAIVGIDPLTGHERWRTPTDSGIQDWRPSGDGNLVVLLRNGGDVSILDAGTGKRVFETFRSGWKASGVAFSEDESSVFIQFRDRDGELLRCALLRNRTEWRPIPTGGFASGAVVSAGVSKDATRIAIETQRYGQAPALHIIDAATGAPVDGEEDTSIHPIPMTNDAHGIPEIHAGRISARVEPGGAGPIVHVSGGFGRSKRFRMPALVTAMQFVESDGILRLLVAGGAGTQFYSESAYYAVIDPKERLLLRLRTQLGTDPVRAIFPLADHLAFLTVETAEKCLVVRLPATPDASNPTGAAELAGLLAGTTDADAYPRTAAEWLDEIEGNHLWRRFLEEAAAAPESRHASFVSTNLLSNAVRPDTPPLLSGPWTYSYEAARTALAYCPDDPEAMAGFWPGETERLIKLHRSETVFSDLDREALSTSQINDKKTLAKLLLQDPVALFYARTAVKRLKERHPKSSAAQSSEVIFHSDFPAVPLEPYGSGHH